LERLLGGGDRRQTIRLLAYGSRISYNGRQALVAEREGKGREGIQGFRDPGKEAGSSS